MISLAERIGDLYWSAKSKAVSITSGQTTRVEKKVLEGPRINGEIRPDIPDVPGIAIQIVMQTGEPVHVGYHQREVRRKIVFEDKSK